VDDSADRGRWVRGGRSAVQVQASAVTLFPLGPASPPLVCHYAASVGTQLLEAIDAQDYLLRSRCVLGKLTISLQVSCGQSQWKQTPGPFSQFQLRCDVSIVGFFCFCFFPLAE